MSYIEREALIRYAEKERIIIKDGTSVAEAMRIQGNVFRRCVETCPTADAVEVRHGEWREVNDKYPRYVCTVCNHLFNNKNYNYCPNCGAKMDGKRKKDEGK